MVQIYGQNNSWENEIEELANFIDGLEFYPVGYQAEIIHFGK
ncbi:hypothetical protein [uncultured Draconibacterium sp.]|nr:hypothetical protein [uncultured Draconibacterium sp.]